MLEIIALATAFGVLTRVRKGRDELDLIGDLISTTWGGVVEELAEELVEVTAKLLGGFFGTAQRLPLYFRKRKIVATATLAVLDIIRSLDEKEQNELYSFLAKAYNEHLDDKRFAKFKKTYEAGCKAVLSAKGDEKKLVKKLFSVIDSIVDSFEREALCSFDYKNESQLAESYFGAKNIPEAVRRIAAPIYECVYQLKYVDLADEDRDIIKLTQRMIKENNQDLVAELADYFSLVIQQNTRAEFKPEVGISASLVRKDPLMWVELTCPKCGAHAEGVERYNDLLLCKICGGQFAVYDGLGDDMRAAIDEMSDALKCGLGKIDGSVSELSAEVGRLSASLLLENERLMSGIVFLTADAEQRHGLILDAVRGVCGEIKREIRQESLTLAAAIQNRIDAGVERIIDELKADKNEILTVIREYAILFMTGAPAPAPVAPTPVPPAVLPTAPEEAHECSVCGREDSHWSDGRHTTCGALDNEKNVVKFKLSGQGNLLCLSLGLDTVEKSATVARIDLADLPSRALGAPAVQMLVDDERPCKAAVKRCRYIVLHSDREIKVKKSFVTLFMTEFSACEQVTLSQKIGFEGKFSFGGWSYDAQRKTFKKRR